MQFPFSDVRVVVTEKHISVLVVDDESAIREMIRFALGKSDMTVKCAASAKEALEKQWRCQCKGQQHQGELRHLQEF